MHSRPWPRRTGSRRQKMAGYKMESRKRRQDTLKRLLFGPEDHLNDIISRISKPQ